MAVQMIEYMLSAEIVLLVHSVIGFILNLFTFLIAGIGLRFKSADLVLIAIVAFLDCIFYSATIARLSLIWYFEHNYREVPTWWCKFDSALVFMATQSTIEIVAILGLMRYLVICHNIRVSNKIWLVIVFLSVALSLSTTLGNDVYEKAYMWSKSGLLCLPFALPGSPSRDYFVGWLSLLVSRFFISVVIISYCYYNILVSYRQSVRIIPDVPEDVKSGAVSEDSLHMDTVKSNQPLNKLEALSREAQAKKKAIDNAKLRTTLKLVSVILAYIVCIVPDIVVSLYIIAGHYDIPKEVFATTHFLVATAGYVSPIFTLLAHEPTKRYLTTLYVKCSAVLFRNHNSTRLNAPFPYENYN